MNRPSPRSIALASLLALHGIAILCGPAVHRGERHSRPARPDAGTGWALQAQAGPSHADCPICHSLAQPQIGSDRARFDSPERVACGGPGLESGEASIPLVHGPRPRAPPRN